MKPGWGQGKGAHASQAAKPLPFAKSRFCFFAPGEKPAHRPLSILEANGLPSFEDFPLVAKMITTKDMSDQQK